MSVRALGFSQRLVEDSGPKAHGHIPEDKNSQEYLSLLSRLEQFGINRESAGGSLFQGKAAKEQNSLLCCFRGLDFSTRYWPALVTLLQHSFALKL